MKSALAAFDSTHQAMEARRLLEGRVPFTVMPTPRSITAACGIALRFEETALAQVGALLADFDARCFLQEEQGWKEL